LQLDQLSAVHQSAHPQQGHRQRSLVEPSSCAHAPDRLLFACSCCCLSCVISFCLPCLSRALPRDAASP